MGKSIVKVRKLDMGRLDREEKREKKKRKKEQDPNNRLMKELNTQADTMEKFVDFIDKYVILEGVPVEVYNDAVATMRQFIKHARNGKVEKIYSEEYLDSLEKH